MTRLKIGKVGRKDFTLPEDLAVETSAVVGRRGQGKTSTGVVIVEELAARGMQIVWIDPTDVAHGIKSSLDGTKAGLEFLVLGGPHGDLPLEVAGGRVIADFVVDHRVSVVLSLRHLRKNGQRQLVTDFAEQLYHRKGEAEHRTPLLVVIDEASSFVPQRVMGDAARMVGAIEDLVRRGRAAGIGVLLIDQRPASVNKDVLTQLSTLVCHQITAPQDRKALDEWIRQHDSEGRRDEFLERLATLKRGEAWFWAPGLDVFECVQVRQRKTFDSSRTPKMGEVAAGPETVAELDLEALREQLAETIDRAEENDPKVLRRRLQQAEAEVRRMKSETPEPDPEALAAAEQRGRAAALRDAEAIRKEVRAKTGQIVDAARKIEQQASSLYDATDQPWSETGGAASTSAGRGRPERPPTRRPAAGRVTKTPPARRAPAAPHRDNGYTPISRPQQRLLDVLAELEAIGITTVQKPVLAALAGVSAKSSAFSNNLGHLRSQVGAIDYPAGGVVALTDVGRQLADAGPGIHTLDDLHDGFRKFLSVPQEAIFTELVTRYPDDADKIELAETVGASPRSSAYSNNLGRMRSMGILDYPAGGRVVATDLLFPEGLS